MKLTKQRQQAYIEILPKYSNKLVILSHTRSPRESKVGIERLGPCPFYGHILSTNNTSQFTLHYKINSTYSWLKYRLSYLVRRNYHFYFVFKFYIFTNFRIQ
uniref:Uncharacterized protein n=1 Tax=Cacopsylla melanoneura TaxID=428564 RepID=A0A8D8XJB1_9HEMI